MSQFGCRGGWEVLVREDGMREESHHRGSKWNSVPIFITSMSYGRRTNLGFQYNRWFRSLKRRGKVVDRGTKSESGRTIRGHT